ncbi:MAG: thioredoxin-disulfide reductase [Chloroflexota bacterium]
MTPSASNTATPDFDVIIVGAGPAGMAAALYTGRARLKTLLLDRSGFGGGQLMNTELIEDYPAIRTISGSQMARDMEEQIKEFDVEITYGEVVNVAARNNLRVVRLEDGTEHTAKTLILTTGGLPRKLGAPGEDDYAGAGVSYCAICDGAFFKGEKLAVIGGGDSAVEEATFLTRYAEKVYIIHRRDEWRAQKLLRDRALANPKIEPIWNAAVDEIGGEQIDAHRKKVRWLKLRDLITTEESRLEVGGVFVYVGFMPNSGIFGPEFSKDDSGFLITDDKMETAIRGVYVAGDVRSQYVHQISNAVGDATIAAVAATRYIEELDATGRPDDAEAVERLFVSA